MGEKTVLIEGLSNQLCRAVFDTNVVLSALVFGGRLGWLRQRWSSGDVIPVVCRETVAELLRILQYPKFRLSAEDRAALLEDYLPFVEIVLLPETLPSIDVNCRDAKDVVFLHLALAAEVDFLVSGDDDLTSLEKVGTIPIISAEAFRRAIGL